MRLRSRGDDPEVARFSAALRRLDEEAFAAFVAGVWEARGRPTTREGSTLSVDSREGGRRRVRVTHGAPTADADERAETVVTSRVTPETTAGGAADAVDAAELLRVVRYAVERERAESLLERHLGSDAARFAEPGAVRADRERTRRRRRRLGRRLVVAVALAACLGGVAFAGPTLVSTFDAPPFEDGGSATPTESGTEAGTEPTTADRGEPASARADARTDYGALGCPPPPSDAEPAQLAPSVVPGASASGLDGWRLVSSESVGAFDDRIRLGSPPEPTARHTARYAPPSGETLRLTVDRWRSATVAEAVTSSLADANQTVLRWGRYTIVVRAFAPDGRRLSRAQTLDRSRVLLAAIRDPSGSRLGFGCVASLLDEATATDGADTERNATTASGDAA